MIGAKLVILTDLPQQIPHLEANVQLNRHLFSGEVVCVPFSFGQEMSDLIEALQCHPSALVQDLLSGSLPVPLNFTLDRIIGADIAYDVSLLAPLSHSISSIVHSSPHSSCIPYLVETGQGLSSLSLTSPS
jgi:hypothetical protein